MTLRPASQQYINIPNPATFCPFHGYEPEYPPYDPDPTIPETPTPLTDESIVLICSTIIGGNVQMYFNTSSGTYTARIYGDGNALLDTKTIASGSIFNYTFTTAMAGYAAADGNKFFKVIVTPTTAGQSLTQCRISSATVVYPIIEAYLNTPNLTIMNFDGSKLLKKVWCCSTMNSLNCTVNTHKVFQYTYALEEITLPTSMNAQTNIDYWFAYSGVKKVVLPASMTALIYMRYAFYFSLTKSITLPNYVSTSTFVTMSSAFYESRNLKSLTIPATWNPTYITIDAAFYNCLDIEDVTIPSGIVLNALVQTFRYCRKLKGVSGVFTLNNRSADTLQIQTIFEECISLKKVEFLNAANSITGITNIIQNSSIEEIVLPGSMNAITSFSFGVCISLKKIVLPLSMSALSGSVTLIPSTMINVAEITKCNTWPTNVLTISIGPNLQKLVQFNQPTLRVASLNLSNQSTAKGLLNYVEIDWINSTWTGTLNLSNNSLSTAEIDRIFTALPTVTGTKTVNMTGNPGYATCTKTIATAKGWTVS